MALRLAGLSVVRPSRARPSFRQAMPQDIGMTPDPHSAGSGFKDPPDWSRAEAGRRGAREEKRVQGVSSVVPAGAWRRHLVPSPAALGAVDSALAGQLPGLLDHVRRSSTTPAARQRSSPVRWADSRDHQAGGRTGPLPGPEVSAGRQRKCQQPLLDRRAASRREHDLLRGELTTHLAVGEPVSPDQRRAGADQRGARRFGGIAATVRLIPRRPARPGRLRRAVRLASISLIPQLHSHLV